MRTPDWAKPLLDTTKVVPEVEVMRFVCGVPECLDGNISHEDGRYTVVDCETHNSRTHHDTVEEARGEQQIIRVQDSWRQHGTAPPKTK